MSGKNKCTYLTDKQHLISYSKLCLLNENGGGSSTLCGLNVLESNRVLVTKRAKETYSFHRCPCPPKTQISCCKLEHSSQFLRYNFINEPMHLNGGGRRLHGAIWERRS